MPQLLGGRQQDGGTVCVVLVGGDPGQRLEAGGGGAGIVHLAGQPQRLLEQPRRPICIALPPHGNAHGPQRVRPIHRFSPCLGDREHLLVALDRLFHLAEQSVGHPEHVQRADLQVRSVQFAERSRACSRCERCAPEVAAEEREAAVGVGDEGMHHRVARLFGERAPLLHQCGPR